MTVKCHSIRRVARADVLPLRAAPAVQFGATPSDLHVLISRRRYSRLAWTFRQRVCSRTSSPTMTTCPLAGIPRTPRGAFAHPRPQSSKSAIKPIRTAGCADKNSCNGGLSTSSVSPAEPRVAPLRHLVTQDRQTAPCANTPGGATATLAPVRRSPGRRSSSGSRA